MLTLAFNTPGVPSNAFSILVTQDAQVIPRMVNRALAVSDRYPAALTASRSAGRPVFSGSYSTAARPPARLTVAVLTPGTARSARSTAWTQLWHVRPDTGSSTRRAPATPARTPVVAEGALLAISVDPIGCPPSVNRDAIPVGGHDGLPPERSPDPPGEGFRRTGIAVHYERARWPPGRGAEPAQQAVRVGVG